MTTETPEQGGTAGTQTPLHGGIDALKSMYGKARGEAGDATPGGSTEPKAGSEGGSEDKQPKSDARSQGDRLLDGEGGEEQAGKSAGAPETYDKLEIPDGFSLDEGEMAVFQEYARTKGWSLEEAQQNVDYVIAWTARQQAAAEAARQTRINRMIAESKEHPELGGKDGAEIDQTIGSIKSTLRRTLSDHPNAASALISELDALGFLADPRFLLAVRRLGQAPADSPVKMPEGSVPGSQRLPAGEHPLKHLYKGQKY